MSFIEYSGKSIIPSDAHYIRMGNNNLFFSEDFFKELGSPKKVQLYFDPTNNKMGIKSSDTRGLRVSIATRKYQKVYEVFVQGFVTQFHLFFEKPFNCRLTKEGTMFVGSLNDSNCSKQTTE
jgi:hypothetical protein